MTIWSNVARMPNRELIDADRSREDAAAQLEVSPRTVDRYIASGKLAAIKRPNRKILIKQSSIDAFLAGEPVEASAAAPAHA